jgi:manganese transport protein
VVEGVHGTPKVRPPRILTLLGPAFVAAIAYVDPGNVAANLSAGSTYGYALVWVLAAASAVAVLVQYLSARLGIVTGRSLAGLVTDRLATRHRGWRIAYASQAFVMAVATDLAEVIGGALGLYLLFRVPLWLGGLIVGVGTLLLLPLLRARGEVGFERAVAGVAVLIAVAFLAGLVWAPPDPIAALAGLLPTVPDRAAWALVAAMLGATVMPHAIYLHSALAVERYHVAGVRVASVGHLLRIQRIDVLLALALAGSVNIAMLLYAAAALRGVGADTINDAHTMLDATLGPVAAAFLGAGLLASGVGSAVVGTHAGSGIAADVMPTKVSPMVTRAITIAPAVLLLLGGIPATAVLVASQIVLSFGIGFAVAPLAFLSQREDVMGSWRITGAMRVLAWAVVVVVVLLNLVLLATWLLP